MTILEFHDIAKQFGLVEVLHGVSFALESGHILGLVGENGSGKSTSMNILGGIHCPTSGQMLLDGKSYSPVSPRDARKAGIGFIHQELSLFENLSIEENLFIECFPRLHTLCPLIHRRGIRRRTCELLELVQVNHAPGTLVNRLSPGERQLIEIAKALNAQARVIILDEPTTSLTHREIDCLFKIIGQLKERGIAMIYISHILDDVLQLCDEVVVLRDGRVVASGPATEYDTQKLVSHMVGKTIDQMFPIRTCSPSNKPLLRVQGLSQPGIIRDISFSLHEGEVLGVAGLMGAGRSELARILFGLDTYRSGSVDIQGTRLSRATPRCCMERGMALITEDRHQEGLMMSAPVLENVALPSLGRFTVWKTGWLRHVDLTNEVARHSQRTQINVVDIRRVPVQHLSGGNQQKVVLAKWLMRNPLTLILDEPTRGIDIGAKQEIYKLINFLVAQGAGVLMISSEIEELIGMCDRILVMGQGQIRAEYARDQFDSRQILESAVGIREE